jgi:serine/threonine protein kinase
MEIKEIHMNNDEYKIIYDANKLIYRIEFQYPNPILINSILKTKLIPGAIRDEDYKIIKFKANSVISLQQFQRENHNQKTNTTALLINSLSKQLNYLITEENHTILGYSLENTIVINEQKFIFLGPELLKEIDEKEEIFISRPFTKNEFFIAPELQKIKSLPSYIHYKTAYFSLGCLALSMLIGNSEFYDEYLQSNQTPSSLINSLQTHASQNTKIYWLLSRCFLEEPKQRSILFI